MALLKPYAGTAKNIWRLLMNAPNLLTDREAAIEARIEYVRVQMRAELPDVVKSTAFAHSLQSLRTRHTFLERLGVYRRRSLKVNAKLDVNNANPRMHQIYDTDERTFATKVAGVGLDEWEVFVQLFAGELERDDGDGDGEEASDERLYD